MFDVKPVINGSTPSVMVFSHFLIVMRNGAALLDGNRFSFLLTFSILCSV